MKQRAFEQRFGERWDRFEKELAALERGRELSIPSARLRARAIASSQVTSQDFPELYRAICRDLSLAEQRRYSPLLCERLNELALGGHRQLYWRNTEFSSAFVRFVSLDFPRALRRSWRPFALACALFVLPGLALFFAVLETPELVYSVLDPEQVSQYELMYDPANDRIGSERTAEDDIQMFGYYIWNNIGISFRTFASGVFAGIGSAFFLVLNGLLMGAISAHMIHLGYQETFFSFVIGHGAFELTAIVISGAAGLRLGYALINPGGCSRAEGLRRAGSEAIQLVYGVIAMLLVAALLEAFWSSKAALPAELKLAVGAVLWAAVVAYFAFLGRTRAA